MNKKTNIQEWNITEVIEFEIVNQLKVINEYFFAVPLLLRICSVNLSIHCLINKRGKQKVILWNQKSCVNYYTLSFMSWKVNNVPIKTYQLKQIGLFGQKCTFTNFRKWGRGWSLWWISMKRVRWIWNIVSTKNHVTLYRFERILVDQRKHNRSG